VFCLSRSLMTTALAASAVLLSAALGEAQTYRFQLQPYCDKLTLTLVPSSSSSIAGIVGYNDNCGDYPRSPIHGTVLVNPDGSFSFGFTTIWSYSVYGNSDVGVQTNVEWPAGSGVGHWYNDDGNSGTFGYDPLDQPSG